MHKRIMALILVVIMIILVTSCAYINPKCSPDKYRAVDYGYDEEINTYYLQYQNERYLFEDANNMFTVIHNPNVCLNLGWHYNLPFTLYKEYYSYTAESPDYIYSIGPNGRVFFKESFDYTKEMFVVEDVEIEFSKAFTNGTIDIQDLENKDVEKQSFRWHSKKHNALYIDVNVYFYENNGYVFIYNMDRDSAYQISDVFLESLVENEIIVYE